MYTLTFAPQALEDLAKLKKSEPVAFKKAGKLLGELQDHPKTGTGKPKHWVEIVQGSGPDVFPRSTGLFTKSRKMLSRSPYCHHIDTTMTSDLH